MSVRVSAKNGALAIMTVRAYQRGRGPAGYYGISQLALGPRGAACGFQACGLRVFVHCPGHARWCGEPESIAWAPDGRHFALAVTSFAAKNRYNGIHIIDTKTGADRQLTSCGGACGRNGIAWSPDGSQLAYAANGVIYLAHVGFGGRRMLMPSTLSGGAHSPSWSPDGRWIAYASYADGAVHLIRSDGTQRSLLVKHASAPAWSPDGRVIAYDTTCGIRLITPAGIDATPATARSCRAIGVPGAPTWSPDGNKIAIGTGDAGVYVMDADGNHLVQLPVPHGITIGQVQRLAWQPLPRPGTQGRSASSQAGRP
jgi:WD40 repeat protein